MPDFMTIGRTTSGSPARYVGGKYALYVSAMCNELGLAEWECEDESASRFPLPTASECQSARTTVLALSVSTQDEVLTRKYNEQLARADKAEKTVESLKAQLDLAHKFHDVAVKERDHARHLLGEVLAVLNGDGGRTVQELGWGEATKRGLARYHDMLARAAGCVIYPCDCTYPRDGQPDFNCSACHGLGAITKTEPR